MLLVASLGPRLSSGGLRSGDEGSAGARGLYRSPAVPCVKPAGGPGSSPEAGERGELLGEASPSPHSLTGTATPRPPQHRSVSADRARQGDKAWPPAQSSPAGPGRPALLRRRRCRRRGAAHAHPGGCGRRALLPPSPCSGRRQFRFRCGGSRDGAGSVARVRGCVALRRGGGCGSVAAL